MTEVTASATQRAPQNAAVKVVEPQSLSERANQMFQAITQRAYELFESEGCAHGRDLEHWLRAEAEFLRPVPLTVTETEDALTVRAEVPGFSAADLQIGVEPGRLTIGGRREFKEEQKKGKTVVREERSSEILRVVPLPAQVDASKATATLSNGVVELILPKASVKAQAAQAG
jgi:HSP20 family molecular chaperone IbpA